MQPEPPTTGRRSRAGDEALIAAEGLTVRYGHHAVLEGVDISVRQGEIVTVIGPNGAGKTTLLRVLLGLLKPDTGIVRRRPGLRLGYLPQRVHVEPTLPLNVARLMTLTVRERAATVREALATTGVEHLMKAAVQTLSGGELQRVLLARTLLTDPDLLVLDEPVQGVDFAGESALYDLIGDIRQQRGCGVLMVSHDLHVVMAATGHVVCLHRHVCCEGSPEAVGQHPEYMQLFGPRAARALAVYTHHHDHAHANSGTVEPLRGADSEPGAAKDRGSRV